jgi:hypothetical protein
MVREEVAVLDGLDNIHGFNQNVVYIREVVS